MKIAVVGAGAKKVINDAKALEKAGAFAILFELVTTEVAEIITKESTIPIIGIGSGPHCHGQVLVITDILGLTMWTLTPKFAKQYVNLSEIVLNALRSYINDVREKKFPTDHHSFLMPNEELKKLLAP